MPSAWTSEGAYSGSSAMAPQVRLNGIAERRSAHANA